MLQNIICKSALALALSLVVVGTAGADDDYSKKGKDHSKKEYSNDYGKRDEDRKKDKDRKRYDDNVAYDDSYDDSYDPSYDNPKMDNIRFDCPKNKKFPADNHKLCDKLGGDFLQVGNIRKCVIDKDPYRVTCKLPKKYPFEADVSAAAKIFIRVGNICVTKKLPGRIVACFDSHGRPVQARKCEDKECFPDGNHGYDDGYGNDGNNGNDSYGHGSDYMSKY